MVITQFEIENFKSFLTRQTLPLAPITLLYGPNGGGKSSVIQALLALRQTFRAGEGAFIADGEDVQLGGFANAVSRHETARELSFAFKRPDDGLPCDVSAHTIDLRFGHVPGESDDAVIKEMTVSWEGSRCGRTTARLSPCDHVPRVDARGATVAALQHRKKPFALAGERLYRLVDSMAPLVSALIEPDNLENPDEVLAGVLADARLGLHFIRPNRFGIPGVIYDSITGAWLPDRPDSIRMGAPLQQNITPPMADLGWLWTQLTDGAGSALADLVHLEPLRQLPERFYQYDPNPIESPRAGMHSQQHWADILKVFKPFAEGCAAYLNKYGVPYKIRVVDVPLQGAVGLFQILLDDVKTGATVTLADVGFGVSQVLPILAHGMNVMGKSKMIMVQQPELHLHPRLQAHLADFFIDTCCTPSALKIGGLGDTMVYRSQWLIETHSEALITRLQRRIREGAIQASDVSVLYLDKIEDMGTVVTPLRLNDAGEFIDEWPGGFFEDGFDDLFGLDR